MLDKYAVIKICDNGWNQEDITIIEYSNYETANEEFSQLEAETGDRFLLTKILSVIQPVSTRINVKEVEGYQNCDDKDMRTMFNDIDCSNLSREMKDSIKSIIYGWRYSKD